MEERFVVLKGFLIYINEYQNLFYLLDSLKLSSIKGLEHKIKDFIKIGEKNGIWQKEDFY